MAAECLESPSRPATDLLFVYGTLLSKSRSKLGSAERQRLAREGELIGPSSLPGRLYSFGAFPILVEIAEETSGIVFGETWRLRAPQRSLNWLDRYEGVDEAAEANQLCPYRRVIRDVTSGRAACGPAWVYLGHSAPIHGFPVPGGRWLRHFR